MSIIKIKHSLTSGNVPASLLDGELAINEVDEILFYKNSSGVIRKMALPSASMDALASSGLQINGTMEIDQEHNGAAVFLTNNSPIYVVDQCQGFLNNTANTAVFSSIQQPLGASITLGNNLGYGFYLVSNTALTSPSSGDFVSIRQPIEGYRWASLNYGLATAHTISIGFWVFTTITGTASVSIRNSSQNRSYAANFTVTAVNTWQWVTVTIPGDQAGAWAGGINVGAYVSFCFASGLAYQTVVNTWAAGNYMATPQNTNFFATNGNQVIITGVVILPGSNMPPVSRFGLLLRSVDHELSICQRYFELTPAMMTNQISAGITSQWISYATTKRAAPSTSIIGVVGVGATNWSPFNASVSGSGVLFNASSAGSYMIFTLVSNSRMT